VDANSEVNTTVNIACSLSVIEINKKKKSNNLYYIIKISNFEDIDTKLRIFMKRNN